MTVTPQVTAFDDVLDQLVAGRGIQPAVLAAESGDRTLSSAGAPFQREDTLGHMQARWNRFGLPRDRSAIMAPGWPIEYGLGIQRYRLPRFLNAGRRAPTFVGHTGASGSWLFWCPEHDLYLAGTVDQTRAAAVPYRLLPRIVHRLRR